MEAYRLIVTLYRQAEMRRRKATARKEEFDGVVEMGEEKLFAALYLTKYLQPQVRKRAKAERILNDAIDYAIKYGLIGEHHTRTGQATNLIHVFVLNRDMLNLGQIANEPPPKSQAS